MACRDGSAVHPRAAKVTKAGTGDRERVLWRALGGARLKVAEIGFTALIALAAACGDSEERPDCRGGVLAESIAGRAGPVSPTGRTVVHYRVPRADLQIHDIAVGPDGTVWYANQLNSCIGSLDPGTGRFSEFPTSSAGANPHGIAVDSAGTVWYAASRHGRVGRIDPATGRSREFVLPSQVRDVHTVLVHAGRVWFTAPGSDLFGYLAPRTGESRTFDGSSRYDRVTASDGAVWIGLTAIDPLVRFSPEETLSDGRLVARDSLVRPVASDGEARIWWRLAAPDSRPRLIASDARGRIWYTDRERSKVGVLDPAAVQVREFPTANERAFVDDLAVGPDGLIWFYEVRTSLLVGLDPTAGTYEFVQIGMPDAGVSHMTTDPVRGGVWLALRDADGGALARLEAVQ